MANAKKEAELLQAARLFGVLAEPARLRILQLLGNGSRCGRELAEDLNLTPATTCHHLEKLKLANLLSERRSGKHVYYSISKSDFAHAVDQSLAALENAPVNRRQPGKKPKQNNRTKRHRRK
jgi:DNA-binding transcriptional ArsR family regulator